MFTGIIETLGLVETILPAGTGKTIWIATTLSSQLKIDQSIAINGVCLTVEEVNDDRFRVTAIKETLQKTNLVELQAGDPVNLERCIQMNGRLDGHIVQGHVDATAVCTDKKELNGSWEYSFKYPLQFAPLIIEKGSVCINGISLTAFNVMNDTFSVAIIPYTFNHTNINIVEKGSEVNIEFDIIGKYITRFETLKQRT